MRHSKDQINERFQILPSVVQDIILSSEPANVIRAISKKYNLHIDVTGLLNEEITYVMVGAEKATDFIRNLKVQLKLPDEKVNAIAKDVNEKIFLLIRKLMMESTQKSEVETKQEQEPKEIYHPPLTESAPTLSTPTKSSEGEAGAPTPEGVGEEIKQQIEEQQAVKPVAAPPPNLPTGVPDSSKEESTEQGNDEDDTSPSLVSLGLKNKKPTHLDPYREPIE